MVVGVLEAYLDGIMVHVETERSVLFLKAHGLELEIGHGSGGVLCQRLV